MAIKQINRSNISAGQVRNIENEINVLDKVSHENIIKLQEKMRSDKHYYLIVDFCNGGDLQNYIEKVHRISEEIGRQIIQQVILGMNHLFEIKAMHRDIKLSNIFIHFPGMEGREDLLDGEWIKNVSLEKERFLIKIGDLGFSKIQEDIQDMSKTYCGTPINMAPEMLNRELYNYKTDVWSVGTVLFELLTGYSPFKEAKTKD